MWSMRYMWSRPDNLQIAVSRGVCRPSTLFVTFLLSAVAEISSRIIIPPRVQTRRIAWRRCRRWENPRARHAARRSRRQSYNKCITIMNDSWCSCQFGLTRGRARAREARGGDVFHIKERSHGSSWVVLVLARVLWLWLYYAELIIFTIIVFLFFSSRCSHRLSHCYFILRHCWCGCEKTLPKEI